MYPVFDNYILEDTLIAHTKLPRAKLFCISIEWDGTKSITHFCKIQISPGTVVEMYKSVQLLTKKCIQLLENYSTRYIDSNRKLIA